jgi:hypothetical protein
MDCPVSLNFVVGLGKVLGRGHYKKWDHARVVPCATLSFGNALIPRALPYTWSLLYLHIPRALPYTWALLNLHIPRALFYPWATTWDTRVSLSTHGGVTPLSTIYIVDNCGNFL